jgi:hypothetical protein
MYSNPHISGSTNKTTSDVTEYGFGSETRTYVIQKLVSGAGWDPDSNRSADPDPDWESGSGSMQAKSAPKKGKKEKFKFSWSLNVLGVWGV